jgi:hypothetical protein
MASLTEQMEELQKQQAILAEKIKAEQERQQKLNDESSIERLEELIKPITESLDFTQQHQLSSRERYNRRYEQLRIKRLSSPLHSQAMNRAHNKFDVNPSLACEEIFVTMLGILKKQEERIRQLETK